MRAYRFSTFGIDAVRFQDIPDPEPGPGEVVLDVKAFSLNYRDLMVVKGLYNPKLRLPATPVSDGAGVVSAIGPGVTSVRAGDRVMSHFIANWVAGPFRQDYVASTLGTPGAGLAAERVLLPAHAVVPLPRGYDFAQASTLPIAALTAWSALITEGEVKPGQTVLTLGTGGVSVFAVQLGRALGARMIITSSSDEKLAQARSIGADGTVNYAEHSEWERQVLALTGGEGVDLAVETAGPGTLDRTLKAVRAGGRIALMGALTGRQGNVTTGLILMKRLRICGIMVDSRAAFEAMCRFIEQHHIEPVISARFTFDQFPDALRHMEAGRHFGKIVVTL